MNLIEEGSTILRGREILFSERFAPMLKASFGAHVANLANRENHFYYFQRRLPDLRSHVLFTAPPGFSKSLFLKQMLDPTYGLLYVNHPKLQLEPPFDPKPAFRFMGSCTEAGWTGSWTGSGANAVRDVGQAEKYARGVLAMEEFVAFTQIMSQEHSSHFEQQLNKSLFGGDVEKDLKSGTIEYHTDVTMWAGNQVMNFNISGGLFRRLMQMVWIPSLAEVDALKKPIWDGDNLPPRPAALGRYRAEVAKMIDRVYNIQSVRFDPRLRAMLKPLPHFEQIIFKNFALGYTIMSDSEVPEDLVVRPTPHMRELMVNSMKWRKRLLADPSGFQVLQLINDMVGGGWVTWARVRDKNLIYSTSYDETDIVMKRLLGQKRIQYRRKTGEVRIA